MRVSKLGSGSKTPYRVLLLVFSGLFAFSEPKDRQDLRELVWTVRLGQDLKEPAGWGTINHHETEGVAFSPDGNRVAVTLAHHELISRRDLRFNTHVFILDVSSPTNVVRQYDLTQTCGVDLTWNDRGDAILICGSILRLDGTACIVNGPPKNYPSLSRHFGPHSAHWLHSDHVVRVNGEIFDLDCKQTGTWAVEPSWHIATVAESRGWVLQWRSEGPPENRTCQYSIVDLASHEVVNAWPKGKELWSCWGGGAIMWVEAEAFCARLSDDKMHCWQISAGKEMTLPKELRKYGIKETATESLRVVVDKWQYPRDPWWVTLLFWWVPVPGPPPVLTNRMVFDLRSRSVVASWTPQVRKFTSPMVEDWPAHCAISANGALLAETADGGLNLYRLP